NLILIIFLGFMTSACEAHNNSELALAGTSAQNPQQKNTTASTKSQSYVEGKDYVEFERKRVIDQTGFGQPVEAVSLLVPKGWQLDGKILWSMPGQGCEGTNQQIQISSPDGKIQIRFNPLYNWVWSSDQMMNQMSMQTAKQGTFCII